MKTFQGNILKLPSHPHTLPLHFPYFDSEGKKIIFLLVMIIITTTSEYFNDSHCPWSSLILTLAFILIYTQDNLSSLDIASSLFFSFYKNTLHPCRAFHRKNSKWFFLSNMLLHSLESKEAFFYYYYYCSSSLLLWVKSGLVAKKHGFEFTL